MGKAFKKIFQRVRDKRNLSTRPGSLTDVSSSAVTGIGSGDPGSNINDGARDNKNRRPGRKGVDTPLGPKGGRRM